ncbi:MAG: hypothetical protein LBQ28_02015 [Prevotellaceae bacterium]|nr:hypothetical protein [Prevotellaceae bacterium]
MKKVSITNAKCNACADIVVNNAAVASETRTYKKILYILDFRGKNGNDMMQAEIELRYNQIKLDVKKLLPMN